MNDYDIGVRVPPQAVDVEESILGAMLLEKESLEIACNLLKPDDFYKPAHKHIFESFIELYKKDGIADFITIENSLKDRNVLDMVGGSNYISDLTRSVSSAANIEYHCTIVLHKSLKRQSILECNEIIKMAYDTETDPYAIVDKFSNSANNLGVGTVKKHSLTPSEIKERDKNTPKAEKLWFGYSDLDHGIFGDSFRRGQVVLTMADSGHGKTVFTRMLARMLTSQGRTVHWFQLEGYDSETAAEVDNDLITICDSLDDIEDIKREARRIDREHKKSGIENGTDYLVFDYVQNIECNQKISKTEKVEYISRQLTKLAIELGAVSNIVSQVTIEGTRTGWQQEPRYNDVRWSKQLKQDASTMIAVFRPSRIESLVLNDAEIQDWKDNVAPYDSVFIKQVKVRHGKQEHKRLHLIHTDEGLKPYTNREQVPF